MSKRSKEKRHPNNNIPYNAKHWATIFSGFSLLEDCNCLSDDCGGLLTIVRITGYIENNVYPAQVQGCFCFMQIIIRNVLVLSDKRISNLTVDCMISDPGYHF